VTPKHPVNFMGRNLRNAELLSRLRGALHTLLPLNLQMGKWTGPFPEVERDGLRAECVRDWPADNRITAQWDLLSRKSAAPHPFMGPVWIKAVVEQLISNGSLRLILVWRGETLKGVFPLAYRANATLEIPHRWVSDYMDPAVDGTEEAAVWSIFLELLTRLWDWSVKGVVLPNIRPELNCRKLLQELAADRGYTYEEAAVTTAARINLPETFDAYMALHSSAERKNTLRKVRKAVGQANARLVEITDAARGMEVLKIALDQMEAGKKEQKAKFVRRTIRPLMMGVGPALFEAGLFKAVQLQILDGKPAATLLVFATEAGSQVYNASYDETFKEWSPGSVLFAMCIEQAIARKEKVFDLLRGGEEYKKRMHATIDPLYRITLRRA
jgi:CelD/BcsL family acetyltransferase involved in cellulose biosynthesis